MEHHRTPAVATAERPGRLAPSPKPPTSSMDITPGATLWGTSDFPAVKSRSSSSHGSPKVAITRHTAATLAAPNAGGCGPSGRGRRAAPRPTVQTRLSEAARKRIAGEQFSDTALAAAEQAKADYDGVADDLHELERRREAIYAIVRCGGRASDRARPVARAGLRNAPDAS